MHSLMPFVIGVSTVPNYSFCCHYKTATVYLALNNDKYDKNHAPTYMQEPAKFFSIKLINVAHILGGIALQHSMFVC